MPYEDRVTGKPITRIQIVDVPEEEGDGCDE